MALFLHSKSFVDANYQTHCLCVDRFVLDSAYIEEAATVVENSLKRRRRDSHVSFNERAAEMHHQSIEAAYQAAIKQLQSNAITVLKTSFRSLTSSSFVRPNSTSNVKVIDLALAKTIDQALLNDPSVVFANFTRQEILIQVENKTTTATTVSPVSCTQTTMSYIVPALSSFVNCDILKFNFETIAPCKERNSFSSRVLSLIGNIALF